MISLMPRQIVLRAIPVIREIALTPPRPYARASVATNDAFPVRSVPATGPHIAGECLAPRSPRSHNSTLSRIRRTEAVIRSS